MLSVSIVSSVWHKILELLCSAGMVHQLCHSVYQLQQLPGTSKRRIQLSLQLHNQLCAVIPNNTILMTLDLASQQRLSTNQLTKEESSIKSTKYTSLQVTNLSKKVRNSWMATTAGFFWRQLPVFVFTEDQRFVWEAFQFVIWNFSPCPRLHEVLTLHTLSSSRHSQQENNSGLSFILQASRKLNVSLWWILEDEWYTTVSETRIETRE